MRKSVTVSVSETESVAKSVSVARAEAEEFAPVDMDCTLTHLGKEIATYSLPAFGVLEHTLKIRNSQIVVSLENFNRLSLQLRDSTEDKILASGVFDQPTSKIIRALDYGLSLSCYPSR